MEHSNKVKVYYSDTDSYGVVWHGAYVKWLEVGRVEVSKLYGADCGELEQNDIVLPVVNLNINYKSMSRLFDELLIATKISEISQYSITFSHEIKNLTSGKVAITATSTVVATSQSGKMYRKLPTMLSEKLQQQDLVLNA